MDWLAHGLPYEGSADLVANHLHADVPVCEIDETLADVRSRLGHATDYCVVTTTDGVVMGLLDHGALSADGPVGEAMTLGVKTVRPTEEAAPLADRMAHAQVDRLLVTDPGGRLLGVFRPRRDGRSGRR